MFGDEPLWPHELIVVQMLEDFAASDASWRIAILRYFNPVGVHGSGIIGEEPNGVPNNLRPYVTSVASGRLEQLSVFGRECDTQDGTGVCDYMHVVDLVEGHLVALDRIAIGEQVMSVWNLGKGKGHALLDLVRTFEFVNGVAVSSQMAPRWEHRIILCRAGTGKGRAGLGSEARSFENVPFGLDVRSINQATSHSPDGLMGRRLKSSQDVGAIDQMTPQ